MKLANDHIVLISCVVTEPEFKTIHKDSALCKVSIFLCQFSVAMNPLAPDELEEHSILVDAWAATATAMYLRRKDLKRGSVVQIAGKQEVVYRKDKNGEKNPRFLITANTINFLKDYSFL